MKKHLAVTVSAVLSFAVGVAIIKTTNIAPAKIALFLAGIFASGGTASLCRTLDGEDRVARADAAVRVSVGAQRAALWGWGVLEPSYTALGLSQQPLEKTFRLRGDELAAPAQVAPVQVRDLTKEIGECPTHVLVASRTGSGKTTTIQAAIAHVIARDQATQFYIFDPKVACWLGLEGNTERYFLCNQPSGIPAAIRALEHICSLLVQRQKQRQQLGGHYPKGQEPAPLYVVVDEFNTLQAIASEFDELDKLQSAKEDRLEACKALNRAVQRIICQGREDNVRLWLMAQTTRVELLGLDTSLQMNLAFFAQGRLGNNQSVEDAIGNPYAVRSNERRRALMEQLMQYEQNSNSEAPVVFSNLNGVGLFELPFIAPPKPVARQQTRSTHHTPQPLTMQNSGALLSCLSNQPYAVVDTKATPVLSPRAAELLAYLQKKAPIDTNKLVQNWGRRRNANADKVRALLQELISAELIDVKKPSVNWVVDHLL